ncbi:STAS domain-containing protein [Actinoplanes sp. NPDC051346]|uniref:STAS domain-containing protein n=1 Tax=Actinoplanes sp. NPDC051346 TaxID=3155048 RepID=UPI00342EC36D
MHDTADRSDYCDGNLPRGTTLAWSRNGGLLTVFLSGDLDARAATALHACLYELLTVDTVDQVVLDLTGVPFCDASGARVLTAAHHLATTRGAECRARRAQPAVAWLLRLTHAANLLGLDD